MKVMIKNHSEKWSQMFKDEAYLIKEILGDELVEIHHIGSTSVTGLKAKPIIDIMPVVENIEKVDLFIERMEQIGYESLGEFGIKGRRYFRKGADHRTHQIHVFQIDNVIDVDRHLAVRDYLRTHSEDAKQYGDLKEDLAKMFPNDIQLYGDGKDGFVKELETKAISWYKQQ
ncbi:GrpB family protein [Sporosarcina sp. G11-34]|uniref:GrpB family protein n=1 Tax=Sporosarcina sp. G11-34 TaxID=2849605 RepID=UPI0022A911B2|nr:GrpB family protein [Sporosarcina sp. G11-34]MCZ2260919.1 GrpB family protein [Sporosarcina sp. G11-34]